MALKRDHSPESTDSYVQYRVPNKKGTRVWLITKQRVSGPAPGARRKKREAAKKHKASRQHEGKEAAKQKRTKKGQKAQGSQRSKRRSDSAQGAFGF